MQNAPCSLCVVDPTFSKSRIPLRIAGRVLVHCIDPWLAATRALGMWTKPTSSTWRHSKIKHFRTDQHLIEGEWGRGLAKEDQPFSIRPKVSACHWTPRNGSLFGNALWIDLDCFPKAPLRSPVLPALDRGEQDSQPGHGDKP